MFTTVATLTATYDAGSPAQPAHCVVRGSAAPRMGADGKAYEMRFELRLPTDWSGRFLYQGGGSALPGTKYFAGRTRPLCPYPSFAQYVGAGSIEDSANFVCAAAR
jgi:hypothetical protein